MDVQIVGGAKVVAEMIQCPMADIKPEEINSPKRGRPAKHE
jgi:hypothetical protein